MKKLNLTIFLIKIFFFEKVKPKFKYEFNVYTSFEIIIVKTKDDF